MSTYTNACTANKAFRKALPGKVKAFVLTAEMINNIMLPEGDGIRLYIGLDAENNFVAHAVPVLKDASGNFNDYEYETFIEKGRPCPTMCSEKNPLNS